MSDALDISEFPKGYGGRRRYVPVAGLGMVASCYTYTGYDGRYYLHPDFGGSYAGEGARSDNIKAPYFMRDIGEYRSPIDGTSITTRSQHREHLKVHDIIEVGNDRMAAPAEKVDTRPIGEQIKRRIEEVTALPQAEYDTQVKIQKAEHAEVAALVTAAA